MPLLDHFQPPLSRTHPWPGFHGAWAAAIARLLNAGVLPTGYYAVPFLGHEGPVEIDVAALQEHDHPEPSVGAGGAGPWTPNAPELAVAVEWPTTDDARVDGFADEGDPLLAAAVELVSPSHKDRQRSREAFAAKCADSPRRGRGLVVVDSVTTRRAELHAELLGALGVDPGSTSPSSMAAISYRAIVQQEAGQFLAWPAPLSVGQPLPTLPLWLGDGLAVPLDLEASHTAACDDLRIRRAV